jgi:hypothetical protein
MPADSPFSWRRDPAASPVPPPSPAVEPEPEPEPEPPAAELRRLRKELAEMKAEAREIELASSLRFNPVIIPPIEEQYRDPLSPGYPMTLWSDWHWGEAVDRRETGGANEFNRDIAWHRLDVLVNKTIMLLRNYAGLNPVYPGMWVCLGGDMISGGIHEELRETNWGTVEEQAIDVGDAIASGLLRLADEFGELHIPCIVGNHGRRSAKPVAKRRAKENREWGVYQSLKRHFRDDPRMHFYIPDGPDFSFSVYGHRFLLTHGDQLGTKGGDGIIGAIGPIRRGSIRLRGVELAFGRDLDTMLIGHYHSYQPPGELFPVMVNGCLKGADEYSLNTLRIPAAPWCQALWIVSPGGHLIHPEKVYE